MNYLQVTPRQLYWQRVNIEYRIYPTIYNKRVTGLQQSYLAAIHKLACPKLVITDLITLIIDCDGKI